MSGIGSQTYTEPQAELIPGKILAKMYPEEWVCCENPSAEWPERYTLSLAGRNRIWGFDPVLPLQAEFAREVLYV